MATSSSSPPGATSNLRGGGGDVSLLSSRGAISGISHYRTMDTDHRQPRDDDEPHSADASDTQRRMSPNRLRYQYSPPPTSSPRPAALESSMAPQQHRASSPMSTPRGTNVVGPSAAAGNHYLEGPTSSSLMRIRQQMPPPLSPSSSSLETIGGGGGGLMSTLHQYAPHHPSPTHSAGLPLSPNMIAAAAQLSHRNHQQPPPSSPRQVHEEGHASAIYMQHQRQHALYANEIENLRAQLNNAMLAHAKLLKEYQLVGGEAAAKNTETLLLRSEVTALKERLHIEARRRNDEADLHDKDLSTQQQIIKALRERLDAASKEITTLSIVHRAAISAAATPPPLPAAALRPLSFTTNHPNTTASSPIADDEGTDTSRIGPMGSPKPSPQQHNSRGDQPLGAAAAAMQAQMASLLSSKEQEIASLSIRCNELDNRLQAALEQQRRLANDMESEKRAAAESRARYAEDTQRLLREALNSNEVALQKLVADANRTRQELEQRSVAERTSLEEQLRDAKNQLIKAEQLHQRENDRGTDQITALLDKVRRLESEKNELLLEKQHQLEINSELQSEKTALSTELNTIRGVLETSHAIMAMRAVGSLPGGPAVGPSTRPSTANVTHFGSPTPTDHNSSLRDSNREGDAALKSIVETMARVEADAANAAPPGQAAANSSTVVGGSSSSGNDISASAPLSGTSSAPVETSSGVATAASGGGPSLLSPSEVVAMRGRLIELQNMRDAAEGRVRELEDEREAATHSVQRLQADRDTADSRVRELQAQLIITTERLAAETKAREAATVSKEDVPDDEAESHAKVSFELNELRKQLANAKESLRHRDADLEEATLNIEMLQGQLDRLREASDADLQAVKAQSEQWKQAAENLSKQVSDLTKRNATLQESYEVATSAVQEQATVLADALAALQQSSTVDKPFHDCVDGVEEAEGAGRAEDEEGASD